jgi:predicted NBD/HSP70 family sugar kinase
MEASGPDINSSPRNLRRAVLALTEAWAGLNRNQLASWLAISRPTVTGLVDDLRELGWAREADRLLFRDEPPAEAPTLGRPEATIQLTEAAGYVAAIHAGHTTLRASIASNAGMVGESRRRTDYDVDAAGPAALADGLTLVSECLRDAGIRADQLRAISIGIPAPVNVEEGAVASSSFMKGWAQTDLRKATLGLLSERLGSGKDHSPEIFIENEVNAMARGALARGVAGTAENFLLLKISSGIGAGIVLGGRVYTGSTGGAGEIGHLRVAERLSSPEVCPRCQRLGCIETVASADSLVRRLRREGPDYPPDIRPSTVVENARNPVQHPRCHRAIVEAGEQIGEVLAGVLSVLDVERVLVGGVLAEAGDALLDPMRESVEQSSISFVKPQIVGLKRQDRREIGLYGGLVLGLANSRPLFLDELEKG